MNFDQLVLDRAMLLGGTLLKDKPYVLAEFAAELRKPHGGEVFGPPILREVFLADLKVDGISVVFGEHDKWDAKLWPRIAEWLKGRRYPGDEEMSEVMSRDAVTQRRVDAGDTSTRRAPISGVHEPRLQGQEPSPAAVEKSTRTQDRGDSAELFALARTEALQRLKQYAKRDLYPSQVAIADEVADDFRKRGIFGTEGKPLSGETIKRHALKGISSATKKAQSTAPERGK